MKAHAWLFAAAMSVSGLTLAQNATPSGVVEITDPARIAEIERHAQQLGAGTPTTPMMGQRDHMQMHGEREHMQMHGERHRMHKHGKRQHRNRAMHQRGMKDKAPSDTPMATEGKN